MKTILYATDFSGNAERAFPYALQLARDHGARLVMLHVFEMPTGWNYPLTEDFAVDREAIAQQALGLLERLFAGDLVTRIEFHTRIPVLSYHEQTLRGADGKGADNAVRPRPLNLPAAL